MGKKWIDLTEPLREGHWRYNNFIQVKEDGPEGRGRYMNIGHAYTHIDAPRHMIHGGRQLDEFPLFDFLIGPAAVLTMENIQPNEGIGKERLEKAMEGCETTDVLLLNTSWGLVRSSDSREYWTEAPYITQDGCDYLRSLNPKVVGFDFPQDFGIRCSDVDANLTKKDKSLAVADDEDDPIKRMLKPGPPTPENSPTHFSLLPYDILMIEYMTNLWEIPVRNVWMEALPLKYKMFNTDGSPIRVGVTF